MKLINKVCKELGVEIGEIWCGSDGFFYQIRRDGLIETFDTEGNSLSVGAIYWEDILTEFVKPTWKPKDDERYYSPVLDSDLKFASYCWTDSATDNLLLERGLVFKTSEEAINCVNNMLEVVK